MKHLTAWMLCLLLFSVCAGARAASGLMAKKLEAFAASSIEFQRGKSQVPFPPLAFVELQRYGNSELEAGGGRDRLAVDQTTVSQGALVPFLMSDRDALFVGEWLSWSHFETKSDRVDDFDVLSVGVPLGWLRQTAPDWQAAAFVMPLGHRSSLDGSAWTWETLGGVFARRVQSDDLWWAIGLFADAGPGDDLYLPYLGAAWSVTETWTLSAVLPWPGVLWAPTEDVLFRLGAAPSGTSWRLSARDREVSVDLSTVDLGFSMDRRVHRNFWARLEIGVGGLRGLTFSGDDWQGPAAPDGSAPYFALGLNYRPGVPGG